MTQNEYIEVLCIDLGFDTRAKKYSALSLIVGHRINYLDELTPEERNKVIDELRLRKYGPNPIINRPKFESRSKKA